MEAVYPVHVSSTRLRLRVPKRRHDTAWLEAVAATLAAQPGISAVKVHPGRAALTLQLVPAPGTTDSTVPQALAAADLRIAEYAPALAGPPLNRTRSQQRTSTSLPQTSAGLHADRRMIALVVFLLLLSRQLLRNGWLAPGLALAWLLWESVPSLRRSFGR